MNFKKLLLSKKGISIIEAIVAVLIISFAIGAPIGVLYQGLRLSQSAKERVEARFLAEEAIEYIRNIKDSNIVRGINQIKNGVGVTATFDQGITNGSSCTGGSASGSGCLVDVFGNGGAGAFGNCPGGSCLLRYNDSDTALGGCDDPDLTECYREYGHGSAYEHDTIYTRKVTVEDFPPDAFRVEVEVSWTDRQGAPQTLQVDEFYRSFGFE